MTSRDFVYWIQGYLEIEKAAGQAEMPILNTSQVQCIKNHLAMVFKHEIDPSFGNKEVQESLSKIHQGISITELAKHVGDIKVNC